MSQPVSHPTLPDGSLYVPAGCDNTWQYLVRHRRRVARIQSRECS